MYGCGFSDLKCTTCETLSEPQCTPETGCIFSGNSCTSCTAIDNAGWDTCLQMGCGFNGKESCVSCSVLRDPRTCVVSGCGIFDDTCKSCNSQTKDECEKAKIGCVWDNDACLPLSLVCDRYTEEANCRASVGPCYWKEGRCSSCTNIKNLSNCNSGGCSRINGKCGSCSTVEPGNDGALCYDKKCGFDASFGFCVSCDIIDKSVCTNYKGCALVEGRCECITLLL